MLTTQVNSITIQTGLNNKRFNRIQRNKGGTTFDLILFVFIFHLLHLKKTEFISTANSRVT